MNQKNIFTGISFVLLLQGLVFFFMAGKIASDAFPSLAPECQDAVHKLIRVVAVLYILVGLVAYSARNTPQVLWAFAVGFILVASITLKHIWKDHINVPIYVLVIQFLIAILCVYLWGQRDKN